MQIALQPYATRALNTMEVVSLLATSTTLYLASFYTFPLAVDSALLTTVTFVILLGNIVVMLGFAFMIVRMATAGLLRKLDIMEAHEDRVCDACYASKCIFQASESVLERSHELFFLVDSVSRYADIIFGPTCMLDDLSMPAY